MAQDVPEALDDTSWIAVKDGTVEAIVKVLDLSDPKPATWVQGMEVVGGYHLVARFRPDEFRSRWQPDVGDQAEGVPPSHVAGAAPEGRQKRTRC
jgi:hypothetical protein